MENGGDLPNATKVETNTTKSSSQSGAGNSPTRRKKRNEQGVTEAGSQTETDTSKKNEDSKNGCPKDFERLDDYLCLHLHKDADENGIQSSFEKSKKYCREKDGSASLLQFVNAKEASKIWKWLGSKLSLNEKEVIRSSLHIMLANMVQRLLNQSIL